jgi:hypothetical protein
MEASVCDVEVVYDIEDAILDPFVYLHGLLLQRAGSIEIMTECARLPETEARRSERRCGGLRADMATATSSTFSSSISLTCTRRYGTASCAPVESYGLK